MARFKLSNKERVVFAPAVASLAAPTRAEINAGTSLCTPGTTVAAGLIEMTDFTAGSTFIDVPDAATDFDAKIPGRKQAGNPSMTFYEDDASTTIRTALAEGTSGYIIRMPYGDVATKRCEVYPVTIGSVNTSQLNSGNEAAKFMVSVAITANPNRAAVIP